MLSGCGIVTPAVRRESKLASLDMGSSRQTVIAKLGNPDNSRGSLDPLDNTTQTDEYRLFKDGTSMVNLVLCPIFLTVTCWTPYLGDKFFDAYSIHYTNGKMDHYGRSDEGQQKIVADFTVKER